MSPALAGRFLTTAPPGKPYCSKFNKDFKKGLHQKNLKTKQNKQTWGNEVEENTACEGYVYQGVFERGVVREGFSEELIGKNQLY